VEEGRFGRLSWEEVNSWRVEGAGFLEGSIGFQCIVVILYLLLSLYRTLLQHGYWTRSCFPLNGMVVLNWLDSTTTRPV